MVRRFQKVDVYKSIVAGFIFNVVMMFGVWPAFGHGYPAWQEVPIIIAIDQALGFASIGVSKIEFGRIKELFSALS